MVSVVMTKMDVEELQEKLLTKADYDDGDDNNEVELMEKVWKENKKMWRVAGPAIFNRFALFGIVVVGQAFIGHIGSTELAAYSLVSTVLLRFAYGILMGMASSLGTLCGQAYGAKQYGMLGIYLQRSWIVLSVASIVLLPLFLFTTQILKFLGQEDYIAEVAGKISLWLIPVMYSYIPYFTCLTFLQAQSKNMIIAYLAAFTVAIHVTLSWLLTVKYELGISGAMTSIIVAFWIPSVGQLAYIFCGCCGETWTGFSVLVFKDLWPMAKLSVASGIMICLEVWYCTVVVLLTGNLRNAEIAIDALAVCLNINGLETMISIGFLGAASVRVSNELGRGSARAAKFSVVMTVLTSGVIGIVLFLVFLFLKGKVAYLFTDSLEVANAVADLSPLLAFSILLNSVQPVLCGVAVGAGWQTVVAYVNLGCYYVIGIPIGVVLVYVFDMQVKGVWIGTLMGILLQTIILTIITWKTDWEEQVVAAHSRIYQLNEPDPESGVNSK